MSKVFQASRGLLKIAQTCHGLTRVLPVRKTVGKGVRNEPVAKIYHLRLPVRTLTIQTIQFKKDPMEYPLLTGAHHWRRKMRTTFRCLDANSDGYITKDDYAITARRCAQFLDLNDERAQHILNQRIAMWEIIPKGTEDPSKVSEEEYINSAPPVFNRNSFRQDFLPMVISMDFDAMDIDGDGLISNEEHKAFFYGLHIPVDESKKIFDVMDTNKDGLISIDEFAHAWTEFFLTEDPNNIYDVLFGKLAD